MILIYVFITLLSIMGLFSIGVATAILLYKHSTLFKEWVDNWAK